MGYRHTVNWLATLLVAPGALAQTVTLDEYLGTVRRNHPFFRKEELTPQIEETRRAGLLGDEDWRLSAETSGSYGEPVEPGFGGAEERYRAGVNAGLERLIWATGGRLRFSAAYDYFDEERREVILPLPTGDLPIDTGPSRFHTNGAFVDYIHPLLRNRNGVLSRLQYDLQEYTVDLSSVQVLENQEVFLLRVADQFLLWVLQTEVLRIERERLDIARQQLEQARRRFESNLIEKVDVLRAEDDVASAEVRLTQTEAEWKGLQAGLAVLSQDESLYNASPDYALYETRTFPSVTTARDRLLGGARVLRVLEERREQIGREIEGLLNAERADLNLALSGGARGGDGEFADAASFDQPEVIVGLEFLYPLGNRTATADVQRARLQQEQVDEEIRGVSVDLEAQLRRLLIEIDETRAVLDLNQGQLEIAVEKAKEEERLYQQGRNPLNFLLQSQDNVKNAALRYAATAAGYQRLGLLYDELMDELLPTLEPSDTEPEESTAAPERDEEVPR
jgi:outer membrane protein TolC